MRLASFVVIGLVVLVAWWAATSRKNDLSIYHTADWWSPNSSFSILHRMNRVRVPYFVRHLPEGTSSVIDLGCGGGLVTEAIAVATSEATVVGFDISEESLNKARDHGAHTPNLKYQYGSIYAIPLANASVDAVIVSDVLEHLDQVPMALEEIYRVLKPGGVVVFDTIARTYWSWLSTYFVAQEVLGIVERGAHDWSLFINPPELGTMLRSSGFDTNESDWIGIGAHMSLVNAWTMGSMYHLIESFHEDKTDLKASYMGHAIKPPGA